MPDCVENLQIWKDSMTIAKRVYGLTANFPSEELYGLRSQIRRAVVSIPANLAEGLGRGTSREVARFARISLGSLYETDTLLRIAAELDLLSSGAYEKLEARISKLTRQVSRYIRYQEEKDKVKGS